MRLPILLVPALLLVGCATPAPGVKPPPVTLAEVGEVRPGSGFPKGYLPTSQVPDSLALLPPPPADGSARQAADSEALKAAVSGTSPERWAQAVADASLSFPQSVQSFADILGQPIDARATPHLAMLLQRSMIDAGLGTYKAKTHYMRVRPFAAEQMASCTPGDEAALRKDGSYPSGHAAIGWMWALVMTDIAPDKADAMLKRGLDFGQSRVICRLHWQSDVEASRLVGAAVFARLQADPVYRAQLALARAEVAGAAP